MAVADFDMAGCNCSAARQHAARGPQLAVINVDAGFKREFGTGRQALRAALNDAAGCDGLHQGHENGERYDRLVLVGLAGNHDVEMLVCPEHQLEWTGPANVGRDREFPEVVVLGLLDVGRIRDRRYPIAKGGDRGLEV